MKYQCIHYKPNTFPNKENQKHKTKNKLISTPHLKPLCDESEYPNAKTRLRVSKGESFRLRHFNLGVIHLASHSFPTCPIRAGAGGGGLVTEAGADRSVGERLATGRSLTDLWGCCAS